MDQQSVIEIMSGQRSGAKARVTRGLLHAASMPYAVAMRARRRAYRAGLLGSVGVDVPVICVGNLTAGGTGKTPMVAWVIRELDAAGKTPAVLSRGYKAVDGQSDEAELLKAVCRVPVVMDPDRVAGARRAIEGGADVLVMDDGFQHRRLRRDLDIVLIDATNPFGFDHVLPRGLLREPPSALRYAGAVVVTRSDMISAEQLDALLERLAALAPGATLHTAVH
ncbi:MAG: tetraacyldisaccharide 4'-kinase, partial [Planctomycetota bacterium]